MDISADLPGVLTSLSGLIGVFVRLRTNVEVRYVLAIAGEIRFDMVAM